MKTILTSAMVIFILSGHTKLETRHQPIHEGVLQYAPLRISC